MQFPSNGAILTLGFLLLKNFIKYSRVVSIYSKPTENPFVQTFWLSQVTKPNKFINRSIQTSGRLLKELQGSMNYYWLCKGIIRGFEKGLNKRNKLQGINKLITNKTLGKV